VPEDDVATTLGELERKLKDLEDELHGGPREVPSTNGAPAVAAPGLAPAVAAPAPAPTPPELAPLQSAPAPVGAPSVVAPAPPPAFAPAPPPAFAPAPPPTFAPAPPPTFAPAPPPTFGATPPVPARAPAFPPSAQAATPVAPGQLEELLRFREQLEQSAGDLLAEYERVLEGLRALTEAAFAAPAAPAPPPAPPMPEAALLGGAVVVEAGPFADLPTFSTFEAALRGIPGVEAVRLRGFEGSHALVDVTLTRTLALGAELRASCTVPVTVTASAPGRLTVAVDPAAGR
jgi:hypothetical protein